MILSAKFFFPENPEVNEFYFKANISQGFDGPLYHYLSYIDGKAVGTGTLFITKSDDGKLIGGLWNGGVLEEARGKGAGTSSAIRRVSDAMDLGVDSLNCTLMSDAMAWGYCKRLGFQKLFQMFPYFHG